MLQMFKRGLVLLVTVCGVTVLLQTVIRLELRPGHWIYLQTELLRFSNHWWMSSLPRQRMTEEEVRKRFEKRLQMLQTACQKYGNSTDMTRYRYHRFVDLPVYELGNNVSVGYCPIQKSGSTTWLSIFRSIRRFMGRRKIQGKVLSKRNVNRDVNFVFVREPYGRLLSAYVDKLLSPNPVFWKITGQYVIAKFRRNSSDHSLRCGHDVTFPEFVKYFIHMQNSGSHRDGHFHPTHDHCDMCHVPYKYIGHLETISDDMPFLLKAIRSPVNYTKTFDKSTLETDVDLYLNTLRREIMNCMSLDEACRRQWKTWQIRGIISKTQPFPLTKEETRDITAKTFLLVALEALGRSGDRSTRLGQKKEALREAFADVPLLDRMEVRRLLFLDFEMFGFDPSPDEVFLETLRKRDDNFSYFRLN